MSGYLIIKLSEMLEQLGEDKVKFILSDFSCPLNPDIENFLKRSSIQLERQQVSPTYLVFTSYQGKQVLIGYFTLTMKTITIKKGTITKGLAKKIAKFANYDKNIKSYTVPAPLIAQLGKNYNSEYDKLISGDELLKIAIEKVKAGQQVLGGKIVYLECEDNARLIDFYTENGFCEFDKRYLDNQEKCHLNTDYLVQLLKYLK